MSSPDPLPAPTRGATEEQRGLQLSAVRVATLGGRGGDPDAEGEAALGGDAEAESPRQEAFAWQRVEGGMSS